MAGGHLPSFGVFADELSGAEATRRVFLTAGGLLLLGLALLIATVWWWRATRPEHPVLAPLEVMGERRWSKSGVDERTRLVEESRALAKAAREAASATSLAPATPVASVPARTEAPNVAVFPAGTGTAVAAAPEGRRREPEPVDLSVLVGSGPQVPDDLAEMDLLLGPVPATGAAAGDDEIAVDDVDGDGDGDDDRSDGDGRSDGDDDRNVAGDGDRSLDASPIDPSLQRTSVKD